MPSRRESGSGGPAHKELRTEAIFQLLDLSAEGWLGDVESFRGATKITLLRNSNEISEMTKLGPLVHLAPALDRLRP